MSTTARQLIPIAAPDIGPEEEAAVLRVLRSGRLVQGPEVASLEEEFARAHGVDHAVAVSNGTSALIVALQALELPRGSEVLIPDFTFAATANAVLAADLVPVFVDIDDDYLMDLEDAAAKVTAKTAAIMPVHLYGLMVDMKECAALADSLDLAIVEDAAQAHMASRGGVAAGTTGVGAFSFYATKNMMTGEGGMVTTNDAAVAARLRLLRNHGMPERYHHTTFGVNHRLTDLGAALGRVQLEKLPDANAKRIANAARLTELLGDAVVTPSVPSGAHHVFHQYTIAVPNRDRVLAGLRERSVGADVYYPTPVHLQPAYAEWAPVDACPRATAAAASVLSLPIHPKVSADDLDYIAESVIEEVGR